MREGLQGTLLQTLRPGQEASWEESRVVRRGEDQPLLMQDFFPQCRRPADKRSRVDAHAARRKTVASNPGRNLRGIGRLDAGRRLGEGKPCPARVVRGWPPWLSSAL